MPWVVGGMVPTTGKNRAKTAAQRGGGGLRRWSVGERIQGWEIGDKSCVRSGRKIMAATEPSPLTQRLIDISRLLPYSTKPLSTKLLNKSQDLLKGSFLPVAQRVRKNPRQFLSISRSRRELGHSVLRHCALDEGRDVLASVAEGAEAVGCAELAHQRDDAVG